MTKTDKKTSSFGVAAAVLLALSNAVPAEYKVVLETASALCVALLGVFSKDKHEEEEPK